MLPGAFSNKKLCCKKFVENLGMYEKPYSNTEIQYQDIIAIPQPWHAHHPRDNHSAILYTI